MKVAVVVYSEASRTYLVDIPDDVPTSFGGDKVLEAVQNSDVSKWSHVPEWDEDADFDGVTDPASIHSLSPNGDVDELLWDGQA